MNNNLLPLTGFKMSIGSNDFKTTQRFAVSATMPGVNIGEISATYRNFAGYVASDHVVYDNLTVRFAVDEKMLVYDELFQWMLDNTTFNTTKAYDIMLNFLSSNFNISRSVNFVNAFPASIGSIEFNVQNTDVEYAYIDVTFRYDFFEFVTESNI